jgi:hypothetical protein
MLHPTLKYGLSLRLFSSTRKFYIIKALCAQQGLTPNSSKHNNASKISFYYINDNKITHPNLELLSKTDSYTTIAIVTKPLRKSFPYLE